MATGDYYDLVARRGKERALRAILFSLLRNITHYYQWLHHLDLTPRGAGRQATIYARMKEREYAETKRHEKKRKETKR